MHTYTCTSVRVHKQPTTVANWRASEEIVHLPSGQKQFNAWHDDDEDWWHRRGRVIATGTALHIGISSLPAPVYFARNRMSGSCKTTAAAMLGSAWWQPATHKMKDLLSGYLCCLKNTSICVMSSSWCGPAMLGEMGMPAAAAS